MTFENGFKITVGKKRCFENGLKIKFGKK